MKTPSDKLFTLISSLTKSEKRYFKRFAMIHSMKDGNSYLQLFDAVEKQKTYNEELLKKKLGKTRLVKYLSVEKAYLYNLILRSLVLYGSGNNEEEEMLDTFAKAKILYKKEIYPEALQYINKAIGIAKGGDYYAFALGLEKLKRSILIKQGVFYDKKTVDIFFKEVAEQISLEKNIQKYQYASDLAFSQISRGYQARSDKDMQKIRQTVKTLLTTKESSPLTVTANRLKHQTAASYYYFTNNYKKYHLEAGKVVEWAAKQPNKSEIYFTSLGNYFNSCIASKNFQELFPTIEKLESLDTSSGISEQYKRDVLFDIKLLAALECCDFDAALDFLKRNEGVIFQTPTPKINTNLQNSAFNAALIYFITGKYSSALKWLNTFFFTKNDNLALQHETYAEANILYILIHYELQNEELLKGLIKSTYRQLLQHEKLHGFERTILDFIRIELSKPRKRKELLAAFSILKDRLIKLKSEKYESAAFEYFDLVPWLESKLENIPLEKIMKAQYQKLNLS